MSETSQTTNPIEKAKPACANCKHWKRYNDMGLCRLSKMNNNMMQSGCGLRTRGDFYCSMFYDKANIVKVAPTKPVN